jgi:hypothetical protein
MLRIIFIVLMVAAAAPLAVPRLGERLRYLPLGEPLAFVIGVAPIALVALILAIGGRRLMEIRWYLPFVAVAGLVGVLALFPHAANKVVSWRMAELAAGDQRKFTRPPRIDTLALVRMQEPACDGLCQRLLLNNQVKRLLYVNASDPAFSPVMGAPAIAFRLERRASCPPANLDPDGGEIQLISERTSETGASPLERMRNAIASGQCLIVERATLGEADVALFRRMVFNTEPSALASLFGVEGEAVCGERLSMYQHDGSMFRESYRRTSITAEKVANINAWYFNLNSLTGASIVRRFTQTYYDSPGWTVFLTDLMGFDLTLQSRT